MNNTESKEPLYRLLNNQRTGGNWDERDIKKQSTTQQDYFTIYSDKMEVVGSRYKCVGFYYPDSLQQLAEMKANAKYITLAVNSLSILAEALEDIIFHSTPETYSGDEDLKLALNKAKEALKRIS